MMRNAVLYNVGWCVTCCDIIYIIMWNGVDDKQKASKMIENSNRFGGFLLLFAHIGELLQANIMMLFMDY